MLLHVSHDFFAPVVKPHAHLVVAHRVQVEVALGVLTRIPGYVLHRHGVPDRIECRHICTWGRYAPVIAISVAVEVMESCVMISAAMYIFDHERSRALGRRGPLGALDPCASPRGHRVR